MSPSSRSTAFVLLGSLLVVLAACGNSGAPSGAPTGSAAATGSAVTPSTTRSYVGSVPGTAALISVVVDGKRAMGYVCDGVPGSGAAGTAPTIQNWFSGDSDGKTVDLTTSPARLQVQLTDNAMTGTITLADGRNAPVAGSLVTGNAGLFRAESDGTVGGWILAANGEQRGGVGGKGFEPGGGIGTPSLMPNQTSISYQRLSSVKISQVGITLIPIP